MILHVPGEVGQPRGHVCQAELLEGWCVLLEACHHLREELQGEVGLVLGQLLADGDHELGTVHRNAEVWREMCTQLTSLYTLFISTALPTKSPWSVHFSSQKGAGEIYKRPVLPRFTAGPVYIYHGCWSAVFTMLVLTCAVCVGMHKEPGNLKLCTCTIMGLWYSMSSE